MTNIIKIQHSSGCRVERAYIYEVIFKRRLGLEVLLEEANSATGELIVSRPGYNGAINFKDDVFSSGEDFVYNDSERVFSNFVEKNIEGGVRAYLNKESSIFVHGKTSKKPIEQRDDAIDINFDIFGPAFLMLARIEENGVSNEKNRGRFEYSQSFFAKKGLIHRPVVDEYVSIIKFAIDRLWPDLFSDNDSRHCSLKLSHDVDWPLSSLEPRRAAIRGIGADIIRHHDYALAAKKALALTLPKKLSTKIDPYNTFDFIMTESERRGFTSTFNFMASTQKNTLDCDYYLDSPFVRGLLLEVVKRGHEIGFHPGYDTFLDDKLLGEEYERLVKACRSLGIERKIISGRQHFLRWQATSTWKSWDDLGLQYDSSVGFAEHIGFRSHCTFAYPAFDIESRKQLNLIEYPLMVMDTTLFSYMQLSEENIIEEVLKLFETVKFYGGDFSLLWHNTGLVTKSQRRIYKSILDGLC